MKTLATTALVSLSLVLAACAGDDDRLSPNEASLAFASTSQALGAAQQAAAAEASVSGESISASAGCLAGGSVAVDGTFADGGEFTLRVVLDSCSGSGISIDGVIDYASTIDASGATISISGTATYSGQVQATCSLDVRVQSGVAGSSVDGTICGQSVSVSSPAV